ncbi:MAG: tetratricopeptide repeat protein [Smithellaceae bacterium]
MNGQMTFIMPECLDRAELKASYDQLYPVYDAVLQSVHKQVRSVLEAQGHTPTIKSRVKRFEAYFDKLIRTSRVEKQNDTAVLTDLLGLRIVCPFLEDLGVIASIISAKFNVLEVENKGAHQSLSEFGYQSVHLLVKIDPLLFKQELPHTAAVCEVQLRTTLQDAWAEVEHELIYKSDISFPKETIKRKLAALSATLTLSDLIFQEIRDHQKDIRERNRKRRKSLETKIEETPPIDTEPAALETNGDSQASCEIDDIIAQADLEKAMLAALDAHSNGKLADATALYTQILRLKLKDSVRSLVYNHRGMAYFGLSDYLRAIRDFSKSVSYNPENVRGYNNRALAFRVLKKFERSLEDYDRSIAINPSQVEGFWGRAQTLSEMKLYTQAIADCEKALNIQDDFTPAQAFIRRINKLIF